jgi:hypothetical protein
MVRPTETKAECEAALVETVRQELEKAATRAKSLPKAFGEVTVQNQPTGVFVNTPNSRSEARIECWPAGADPRGAR